MNKIVYFILIQIFMSVAMAESLHKTCVFSSCATTPEVKTVDKPSGYASYNDLTRMPGGFNNEYASKVLVRGIVVDKECIPIANAKIKFWQRDEYGDYRYYKKFATAYEKYKSNYKMYRQFRGHGTAFSDNTGKFLFITVKPSQPKKKNFLDGVNAMVSVKGFNDFETKIYLQKTHNKKEIHHGVSAHLNLAATKFYGKEVYDVYIVLDGLNKYRRY
ncbi:MAG: hypothetical protein K0T99_04250 [Alphaproteobacteria bacterium]|nr:hypothetical protein [Alphaproteobacteria bacterium]